MLPQIDISFTGLPIFVAFFAKVANGSNPAVIYKLDGTQYTVNGNTFSGTLGPFPIPASCTRNDMFILFSVNATPNYYCLDSTNPSVAAVLCVDDDTTNRGKAKLF